MPPDRAKLAENEVEMQRPQLKIKAVSRQPELMLNVVLASIEVLPFESNVVPD